MQLQSFRNPLNYTALLFPLIAVLGNKLLVVVMLGMTLAAAFAAWPWTLRVWRPLLVAFALLLLWSLMSALWSINPGYSNRAFRPALWGRSPLGFCFAI